MIPKTIHYCWFGKSEMSPLILGCIESWREFCPNYKIILWDENIFDVNSHPFTKKMYEQRKYAFVADYVRLYALYAEGGVYLDTDMLLCKDLSPLLSENLLLGKESEDVISCGMIGAEKNNLFIKKFLNYYDSATKLEPNPTILTKLYYKEKPTALILPSVYFYPFDQFSIKKFTGKNQPAESYGVHLWNYSWGHPLNKFFKKIGIYTFGKRTAEKLGIKKYVKKILGFI